MADSNGVLGSLERWSPTLWLASGALTLVYSFLRSGGVSGTNPLSWDFIGPAGYIVAFTALLGL